MARKTPSTTQIVKKHALSKEEENQFLKATGSPEDAAKIAEEAEAAKQELSTKALQAFVEYMEAFPDLD